MKIQLILKLNSVLNPNLRAKTIKHLEENIAGNLNDFGFGNDFLDITLKAQETKAKIDRWNYIKMINVN